MMLYSGTNTDRWVIEVVMNIDNIQKPIVFPNEPKGAIVLWNQYNQNDEETIIEETKKLLTLARDSEKKDDRNYKWGTKKIPNFYIVRRVPNLLGQDTSKMQTCLGN